ncbi:MAG: MBL fold metallo-hydrolase [Candidatus Paceibacterota bacterium]
MIITKLGKAPRGGKRYENIEPTAVMPKDVSFFDLIKAYVNASKLTKPSRQFVTDKADLHHLVDDEPVVVWFGHSSYLISHKGFKVLVDPVLFGPASPVSFIGHGFTGTTIYTPEDFPEIDLLIITHDHYDHLSYETVLALKGKIKNIITSAGVQSHLNYWGFDSSIITALDWHQSSALNSTVTVTAFPARHFSGRFLTRGKTLWSSFVLELNGVKIFIGGDSGYDKQFKIIGNTHGPFDMAFIECGQYNKNWPEIHMFPEQTAQAATDLKTTVLLPVHWGKFVLSVHAWNDPIKRLMAVAPDKNYQVVTPMLGEVYTLGKEIKNKEWWNFE